jgi:hypothetical protein
MHHGDFGNYIFNAPMLRLRSNHVNDKDGKSFSTGAIKSETGTD